MCTPYELWQALLDICGHWLYSITANVSFSSLSFSANLVPQTSPNNCQDILIVREAMAGRQAVCPLERVKCEYHQMGCDIAVLRRDMADHTTRMMAKHLDLSKHCILKMANKYAMVKNSLKEASIGSYVLLQ